MTAKRLSFFTYGSVSPKHIWTLDKGEGIELRSEPHLDFNSMLCHCVYALHDELRDPEKIEIVTDDETKQILFIILNNLYPEAPS